jgi:hypothetical protein
MLILWNSSSAVLIRSARHRSEKCLCNFAGLILVLQRGQNVTLGLALSGSTLAIILNLAPDYGIPLEARI